jgi:serine palmitoyltransferase
MLERGVAVVTVGFPATVLTGARVRFCISAAHTREMLDKVLEAIDECGDMISVKFSKKNPHLKIKEQ